MGEQPDPDPAVLYAAASFPGVALHWVGYRRRWVPDRVLGACECGCGIEHDLDDPYGDGEHVDDPDWSHVVLVGDDHVHEVPTSELRPLDDGEFCADCGQILPR